MKEGEKMKKLAIGLMISSILSSCATFKPTIDGSRLILEDSTQPGRVVKIIGVKSNYLELARNLYVYLPFGYDEANASYPVIYAQDGNNLFSKFANRTNNWNLDLILDRMIEKKEIPKVIVVGIGNTGNRTAEYEPYIIREPKDWENLNPISESYLKFLTDELIPYVEKNYRALNDAKDRILLGSSFGGTFSLYAAMKKPETFGKIVAMSPSLWMGVSETPGTEEILKDYENATSNSNQYADSNLKCEFL